MSSTSITALHLQFRLTGVKDYMLSDTPHRLTGRHVLQTIRQSCLIDTWQFQYCTYRPWCKIRFIKPTLHALKCEHDAQSPTCWHFLSAIFREFLYGLKLWHYVSKCFSEWLRLTLQTNSKDTILTDVKIPRWWHSKNAESCRRLCIYLVHISNNVK